MLYTAGNQPQIDGLHWALVEVIKKAIYSDSCVVVGDANIGDAKLYFMLAD